MVGQDTSYVQTLPAITSPSVVPEVSTDKSRDMADCMQSITKMRFVGSLPSFADPNLNLSVLSQVW